MYFASICPTKKRPFATPPFHCAACESRCCHNSSAPGDPFGIFPAGIWPPTHPAGHFLASPQGTLQNQNNSGKMGKSPQKVEPATKIVWLRFWYVLISVFFVHALKHEVVFLILNHGQVCHFWRYFCDLFTTFEEQWSPKKGHTCQLKTTPTRTLHMSYYDISFVYLLSFHSFVDTNIMITVSTINTHTHSFCIYAISRDQILEHQNCKKRGSSTNSYGTSPLSHCLVPHDPVARTSRLSSTVPETSTSRNKKTQSAVYEYVCPPSQ